MADMIRIAQLSDTHFLEQGALPEGGHTYDIDAAFEAVLADLGDHPDLDMVVVTGDIADQGLAIQYRKASAAFSRLPAPVNVCPGNHDFDRAFQAGVGRPGVGTSRVVEIENWSFLFVDSNAGIMRPGEAGLPADPPGKERLHNNGLLGDREAAWIGQMCEATLAEHVFIWLHHPPDVPVPMSHSEVYANEWRGLLAEHANIRGLGGGHTHIPDRYEIAERPVFVAPSLKNNFSLEPQTWLPPGYRTYEFSPDGSIASSVHLIDDERWPRKPFGSVLKSLFMAEITFDELVEIAAQREDLGSL